MDKLLPREKALRFGISSLDDQELLALILKSGCSKINVIDLANEVLEKTKGFKNLCSFDYEELLSIKGLGKAKALELVGIVEIYKRMARIEKVMDDSLSSPDKLVNWIRFNIAFKNQEEFFVLYLSSRGTVIKSEVLFKGTKSQSLVSIDEVLRRAVLLRADALVVAHNHPSGFCKPSKEDIDVTDKLANCLKMMDLRLLDHLIVTKCDYFSFKEAGLI